MLDAVSGKLGALREREFRVLFLAQAVSVVGDNLVPVALAFAVLDLTGSASDLGLVLVARVLPMVGLFLVGGVWGDRLPRQRVMIAANVMRGSAQAGIGVLLVTGHADIWHLVVLQAVHGTASAFYRPATSGLVPEVVSAERLQQANALLYLTFSVGGVVGPALAGVLVTTVGSGWAILLDAASFAVATLLLATLRLPPLERAAAAESFARALARGWGEVRSRTWLWASIGHFALFQLVYLGCFSVLGPVVAKRELGGASSWALIVTAFGIGSIVGGLVALRFRPRRPLLFCFVVILGAVPSLVLLGASAPTVAIAATELMTGFALGASGSVWETTLQEQVPREALSRVASYDWMGSTVLRPVGLALAGPVSVALGVDKTLYGAAGILLLATSTVLALDSVRGLTRKSAALAAE